MTARSTYALLVVLFSVLAAAPSAAACTVDWDGGGGNLLWSNALNWSGDAVPGASDDACIPALVGDPVVVDGTVVVASVAASHPVRVVGSLSAVLDSGTFTLADGSTLDEATIDGATVLVPVGETAVLAGGEFAAGTLLGGGEAAIVEAYDWTGGRMLGDGVTSIASGVTMTIDAPGDNGSPQGYGASIEDDRHLLNAGTIVWDSGYFGMNDQATLHNAGTISLLSTSVLDTWESNIEGTDQAVLNTGLIEKPVGTNSVSFPGIANDGVVRVVRGTLEPYTLLQTTDGRVEVELGGTTAGVSHGVVETLFSTRLSGTLAATLSTGYTPALGDVFHVIKGAARAGTFSALALPPAGAGQTMVATYLANGVDLNVIASPTPRIATAPPASTVAAVAAPPPAVAAAFAPPEPLRATDDVFRRRSAARVIVVGSVLANDAFPAGTRVQLLSRSRFVTARLDRRTGRLRVRVVRRGRRVVTLRYRLVAPDGRRSRAASVRIVLR